MFQLGSSSFEDIPRGWLHDAAAHQDDVGSFSTCYH